MGNRHGASLSDLFTETGITDPLLPRTLPKRVVMKRVSPFTSPRSIARAQTLYIDFGQALATAHDVRGVHRLIRTDHHKFLHTIAYSGIRHHTSTEHVCSDRPRGVLLH